MNPYMRRIAIVYFATLLVSGCGTDTEKQQVSKGGMGTEKHYIGERRGHTPGERVEHVPGEGRTPDLGDIVTVHFPGQPIITKIPGPTGVKDPGFSSKDMSRYLGKHVPFSTKGDGLGTRYQTGTMASYENSRMPPNKVPSFDGSRNWPTPYGHPLNR